jgi:hypothetical protein
MNAADKKDSAPGNNLNASFEEDPVEAYKREFKRKRWEREKQERQRMLSFQQRIFKIVRRVTVPIMALACVLIVDSILPERVYHEEAEVGWQKRFGKGSNATYGSYMQTKSFVLAVPHELHLNYPYYDVDRKQPLAIEVSPIFGIPKRITVVIDGEEYRAKVLDTVYYFIPLHYLLFASALITLSQKRYSRFNYVLSFCPLILLCLILLKLIFEGSFFLFSGINFLAS